MLVVSRKNGEEVVVPQFGIVFKILEIRGSQVRIGITAPSEVGLYRREVWERKPCAAAEPRVHGEEAQANPR